MGNAFLNLGHSAATGGGSNNDREHIFNVLYYCIRKYQLIVMSNNSKLNAEKGNSLYLLHPITYYHHNPLPQVVNNLVYTILYDNKL